MRKLTLTLALVVLAGIGACTGTEPTTPDLRGPSMNTAVQSDSTPPPAESTTQGDSTGGTGRGPGGVGSGG